MTRFAILLLGAFFAAGANGADFSVSDAWIRLLPAGVPAGGYFTLRNEANTPAELVGVHSIDFGQTMMHRSVEDRGLAKMEHVDAIAVPARGKLLFAPGGYHVMMMQPRRSLAIGERVPVTLEFSSGEKITAQFVVRGPAGK